MKKLILPFIILISFLIGCTSDKDGVTNNPVQEGDEICFSSQLTNNFNSRTIYSDLTTDANGQFYPINWVDGDQILIYCPEASNPPEKYASYKIKAANPSSNIAATVSRIGDIGLQWSGLDLHHFIGFYPANSINKEFVYKNEVMGTIPWSQFAITQSLDADKNIILHPNMDYAYMAAYNAVNRTEVEKNGYVNLSFKPLMSALDIVVQGSNLHDITISSITISASKNNQPVKIAGNFSIVFDDTSNNFSCKVTNEEKIENIITLNMPNGNLLLPTNKILKVKAFLIPDAEVLKDCEFKISVNSSLGINTKTYKKGQIQLQAGKIFRVKLPPLKGKSIAPEYWMSEMDPNTYLTEVSYPGSTMSDSHNQDKNYYQSSSIKEQFKAGVRAFHLQTMVLVNQRILDGGGQELTYELETTCNNGFKKSLYEILFEIADCLQESENQGKRESALVMLTYEDGGFFHSTKQSWFPYPGEWIVDGNYKGETPGNLDERNRWLKTVMDKINLYTDRKHKNLYRIYDREINSETTLGDVANQIIIKANTIDGMNYDSFKDSYWNPTKPSKILFSYKKNNIESNGIPLNWSTPVNHSATTNLKWLYQEGTTVGNGFEINSVDDKIANMNTVLTASYSEYQNSESHNVWFMNNIGGAICQGNSEEITSADAKTVAKQMNTAAIEALSKRDSQNKNAALGLIFMNFADRKAGSGVDVKSDILIQRIIDNNFKFPLRKKKSY